MLEFEKLAEALDIGGAVIRNRVFLAPLSGITDRAFRSRAYMHGAGMVVSEMVASGELARGRVDSQRRIGRSGAALHVVQLAGRDARWMAEGARIAVGEGADIVDINMGCPAKKVTGGYCGSALMRDLDLAESLIAAVVGAVEVPVTVKMRLGWDETELVAPELACRAEQAGVRMVTVHGRTRCQFYKGQADWKAIAAVKQAVGIPVVANGDILSAEDARRALAQSGADAVMIGRAHCGAPWVAGEIAAEAAGTVAPGVPSTPEALADYVQAHYEDMLSLYGVEPGVRHARKHLGWYLDRHAGDVSAADRRAVMTSTDPKQVTAHLRAALLAGGDAGNASQFLGKAA
ncbi:tRNA dihydrouridine synthase DusB [Aquibium oceanicum]|uniref:tRNA-dihydrouridine synthase n=1 Tax=Aquibium oceanicum TaxID=1670800 RepID=A0A1L3ST31_9HYPH|nr:tRNA dihydrouridine synthase DusB [Aquibium oceanicum]APH72556.1 tRNA dihydrouridine synthase DusB [Aquibium oceanicum]